MTARDRLLSPRFSEALSAAAEFHAAQTRKGTRVPYIAHLLEVASITLHHGGTEDEAIAALLHDTIEDAPDVLDAAWVRRWIRYRFGETVLAIVEGCTDNDVRPKPPWRACKEAYVARVRHESASVILVSAADKLHNTSNILTDLRELGDAVWSRFSAPGGKGGTIGYYRGLVAAYQSTGHHPALVRKVDAVVTALEHEAGLVGEWPLP